MAADPAPAAIRSLERLYRHGTSLALSEGQLLERFLRSRDESAFEALVARHGPMVLRTCRALLTDPHDADDAFQATFLVLARRAGSVRDAELLGPWLHRVARRISSRANRASSRRRLRERPSSDLLPDAPAPDRHPHPDRLAIHEAIDRLPGPYRLVLILCDLEGHTHAEAASRLGWPLGTVKGRQSRARSLLRRRLSRLGLAPSLGSTGLLLPAPFDAAIVSPSLASRTARAAAAFAAGGALAPGTVPASILALANGVTIGMLAPKITAVTLAGLLSLGAVAAGFGSLGDSPDVEPAHQDAGPAGSSPAAPPIGQDPGGSPAVLTQAPPDVPEPVPDPLILPLLGSWLCIEHEGGADSDPLHLAMEIRRANPGLARSLDWEGVPLLVALQSQARGEEPGETETLLAFVDPVADPRRIDFIPLGALTSRERTIPVSRGIYRLDGGSLTIRVAQPGEDRPTGFDREPAPGTHHLVYHRVLHPDAIGGDDGEAGVVSTPVVETPGVDPPARVETTPATPTVDDAIRPLLGIWATIPDKRDPASARSNRYLELRPADPGLARLLGSEATPLLAFDMPVGDDGQTPGRRATSVALVDPRPTPGHLDFVNTDALTTDGPAVEDGKGVGIYRVDGDSLTIAVCYQRPAGPRPTAFEADAPDGGSPPGTTVLSYRRLASLPGVQAPGGGVAGVVPTPAVETPGAESPAGVEATPSTPPEADDLIAPYLGTWSRVSTDGEPMPERAEVSMELRRARPGLADVIDLGSLTDVIVPRDRELHVLVASFVTRQPDGTAMSSAEIVILDAGDEPDRFTFLPVETLKSGNRPVADLGYGGRSRIEGDRLTIHLGHGPHQPDTLEKSPGAPTTLDVYRKVAGPDDGGVAGVGSTPAAETPRVGSPAGVETTPATPVHAIESLTGSWKLDSMNGEPVPEWTSLDLVVVKGRRAGSRTSVCCTTFGPSQFFPPQEGVTWLDLGIGSKSRYAIVDPDATPSTWDFRSGNLSLGADPVSHLGIYRVEGDTLTLHVANEGAPRPTGFERQGRGSNLYIYTRVRPEANGALNGIILDRVAGAVRVAGVVPPLTVETREVNRQGGVTGVVSNPAAETPRAGSSAGVETTPATPPAVTSDPEHTGVEAEVSEDLLESEVVAYGRLVESAKQNIASVQHKLLAARHGVDSLRASERERIISNYENRLEEAKEKHETILGEYEAAKGRLASLRRERPERPNSLLAGPDAPGSLQEAPETRTAEPPSVEGRLRSVEQKLDAMEQTLGRIVRLLEPPAEDGPR